MKTLFLCLFLFCVVISQMPFLFPYPNWSTFRCPNPCVCIRNQCLYCKNDRYSDPKTNCTRCYPGYTQGNNGCIPANQNTPCPAECICRGIVSWGCTSCVDPNTDLSSKCLNCLAGYHKDDKGKCVTNSCPKGCECRGFVPWTCTKCLDENADISTNCTTCSSNFNFEINQQGKCVQRVCPARCRCFGINPYGCTGCIDIHKSTVSNCTQCIENYTLGYDNSCKWSVAWCPEDCVCNGYYTGCSTCKIENFNVRTNCTTCLDGYQYVYSDMYGSKQCRAICLKRCVCTIPNTCAKCISPDMYNVSTNCTTCIPPFRIHQDGHCGMD